MALVAGSLHDWLAQSSYVRGRDQTGAVVGRKKCRAHRKGSANREDNGKNSDRAIREGFGKVSNRRYRRWLNDQLLRDLAPPMEAAEIEGLFAPPPWGEQRVVTPLERVTGGGLRGHIDMADWEPFRNVDMDTQARWIRHAEQQRNKKGTRNSSKQAVAMEAWKSVERTAREALRRNSQSPLLQAFEEKLLVFLSEADQREGDEELALEAETSYHRLLLHGLTQFHGLASRTVKIVSKDDSMEKRISPAPRIIMIKKRHSKTAKTASPRTSSEGPLNLIEFLREVQQHSQVGLVA
ncbi:unnamed protein product [Calypogeia fissa]